MDFHIYLVILLSCVWICGFEGGESHTWIYAFMNPGFAAGFETGGLNQRFNSLRSIFVSNLCTILGSGFGSKKFQCLKFLRWFFFLWVLELSSSFLTVWFLKGVSLFFWNLSTLGCCMVCIPRIHASCLIKWVWESDICCFCWIYVKICF